MPLSEAMRNRFVEELDAKKLDFKEASLKAKWRTGRKAGKTFNETYVAQLLNQGRGTLEALEILCEDNGLDVNYVRTGRRSPKTLALPAPQAAGASSTHNLDFDALQDLIAAALRLYGAVPQDAERMAKTAVSTWLARRSPG